MTAIPDPLNSTAALIDAAQKQDPPRPHMGASMLGHPCDRWLWLNFRWAVVEEFDGRILRLFRRGHNEEATIMADLEAIGVRVISTQGRVNFGAHVSGSVDGVLENVPEAPKTRHLAEFKTHSLKSFNDLRAKGVEASKPMHFIQMQVYMMGLGLARALYVAVCKDDDRLHIERIKYDEVVASKFVERGRRLALDDRLPPPISTDPSWYQCKFCPAHSFCHGTKLTKQINCRTCALSTPLSDSTWSCERHGPNVPEDWQRTGCDGHVLHPDLVPWPRVGGSEGAAHYKIGDRVVINGDDGYLSKELLADAGVCGAPMVDLIKATFEGAEVISNAS